MEEKNNIDEFAKDIIQFLKLPDWKKISCKINYPKFNSYPIQTKEQEHKRSEMLYALCAHFAMMNYDEFINSLSSPIDDIWPRAMELFITPTLLDLVNLNTLIKYAYCPFCEYYAGLRIQPRIWDRMNRFKVIPVYGRCDIIENTNNNINLGHISSHVSIMQRCPGWNPIPMIESTIDLNIKKLFASENFPYYYSDYKKDLEYLDLWDFLRNRYRQNQI